MIQEIVVVHRNRPTQAIGKILLFLRDVNGRWPKNCVAAVKLQESTAVKLLLSNQVTKVLNTPTTNACATESRNPSFTRPAQTRPELTLPRMTVPRAPTQGPMFNSGRLSSVHGKGKLALRPASRFTAVLVAPRNFTMPTRRMCLSCRASLILIHPGGEGGGLILGYIPGL
ncbi:hypothetical protein BJX99DRAFT_84341 [Aspergillus californicus]